MNYGNGGRDQDGGHESFVADQQRGEAPEADPRSDPNYCPEAGDEDPTHEWHEDMWRPTEGAELEETNGGRHCALCGKHEDY